MKLSAGQTEMNRMLNLGLMNMVISIAYTGDEIPQPITIEVAVQQHESGDGAELLVRSNLKQLPFQFVEYAAATLMDASKRFYNQKNENDGEKKEV